MPDEEPTPRFAGFDAWCENRLVASGPPIMPCHVCIPLSPTVAVREEVRVEARRRLAIIAAALERHRLRFGTYPDNLSALIPQFLDQVWASPENAKQPRYRLTSPRRYALTYQAPSCNNLEDWPSPDSACFLGWSHDNPIIPVIEINESSAGEAIEQLAALVTIDVAIEPVLRSELNVPLELRIEGVTARAVLGAVLNNHALSSHYDAANDRYLIRRRP